jgi:RNA-binding protein Musashi
MRDPDGRSRGFAFLTFEDAESVSAVLARDHILDGKSVRRPLRFHPLDVDFAVLRQIDPKRAIPREEHLRNTRYFVGGLSPSTNADSMREFFSTFGKVIDATVMVDRESGRSKGFGFVTFEDATNSDQFVGKLGLILDDKQASIFLPLGVNVYTRQPVRDQQIEVKTAQPRSQRDQARNLAANREPYFNDQDSRTPSAPIVPFNAQQAGNPAASMLYQRMMNQMPHMSGPPGIMNPMMLAMGMGGMGGMNNMNHMGGMNGLGGVGLGGLGMIGGMGPMNGMNPMAMRMGMNGPMGIGMMGQPGGAMGIGNVGMRMRQGMGMGVGPGMAPNAGRMTMNSGLGPSRMSTRGQHAFHPYAR